MKKSVNLGLCGLGTVGSGVVNVLTRNQADINRRLGRTLRLTHIGARRDNPACDTQGIQISRDIFDVAKDPNVDILLEVIGGTDVAKDLVMTAIDAGKHVVTANKALIALHGQEIMAAAEKKGVRVAYEAAVAGGIPILKALREGLAANQIQSLAGIINGTGNFILTNMETGRAYDEVLAEAQTLGYAEADPTFDVEGIDAAHKLTILASLAYGVPLDFNACFVEGISNLEVEDIQYASELGYRIKHLGISRLTDQGVELRVHPTLIPKDRMIAKVDGVMNAVMVTGDAVGETLYYGAGAGSEATASAVLADTIDIALNVEAPVEHQVFSSSAPEILPMSEVESAFYLRMRAEDRAGVLAKVASILSVAGINIEAIIQKEPAAGESQVPVIMLTHKIKESTMQAAIAEIEALDDIRDRIRVIRMDQLG